MLFFFNISSLVLSLLNRTERSSFCVDLETGFTPHLVESRVGTSWQRQTGFEMKLECLRNELYERLFS